MAKPGRKKKTEQKENIVQDIIEPNETVNEKPKENDEINTIEEQENLTVEIIETKADKKIDDHETIIEEDEVSEPEAIVSDDSVIEQPLVNNESSLVVIDQKEVVTSKTEQPKQEKIRFIAETKNKWHQLFNWFHSHMLVYRIIQIVLCIFLFIGANVATSALTYFGYIQYKYYRIPDGEELKVERNRTWYLTAGNSYTVLTMDIGHGIQTPEYSNINETGKMLDGTKTQGEYNYGIDETSVLDNVTKLKDYIRHLDLDFYAFQDVDVASTRSYMIDQYEQLNEALSRYSRVAARFHHTQYLVYPFKNPIGLINNDLVTYSRYKTTYGLRQQLPITTSFISRLSSADNAFSLALMPVNGSDGKYLVILNVNLDKDVNVRKQQMDVLNAFMLEEYEYGSYVIVAGNFNADTATVDGNFANQQQKPTWLTDFDESQIIEGFTFVHPTNESELADFRTTDLPYEQGVNYQANTSGFIISNNITAESVILDTNYQYSNHNPVQLTFKLNKPEKK